MTSVLERGTKLKLEMFIPIANGLVHELRSNGAIDATTHSADNATLRATNFSNSGNLLPNELFLVAERSSHLFVGTTGMGRHTP